MEPNTQAHVNLGSTPHGGLVFTPDHLDFGTVQLGRVYSATVLLAMRPGPLEAESISIIPCLHKDIRIIEPQSDRNVTLEIRLLARVPSLIRASLVLVSPKQRVTIQVHARNPGSMRPTLVAKTIDEISYPQQLYSYTGSEISEISDPDITPDPSPDPTLAIPPLQLPRSSPSSLNSKHSPEICDETNPVDHQTERTDNLNETEYENSLHHESSMNSTSKSDTHTFTNVSFGERRYLYSDEFKPDSSDWTDGDEEMDGHPLHHTPNSIGS
ncbi:hypothetical protein BLNAU_5434 [Blattamonas nauphoetae]|uniref:Arrestin C-terminal-like domain-containing protein n=1 Tax=Blattamonas nauphoetae TaxID=2049346 RepID=A0ABQ9Y7D5_9EUKA|nr:hypothetical protein BLNAU_5434 [Blattamonas nauphoetae]